MNSRFLYAIALAVISFAVWFEWGKTPPATGTKPAEMASRPAGIYGAKTWSHPETLPDHFARHGRDFAAKDAEDYARMAYDFFQRAEREGLSAKVDAAGVYRVFDPASGTFGAYNADGTTKTFFKPGKRSYFEKQPGRLVNLRTRR